MYAAIRKEADFVGTGAGTITALFVITPLKK